MDEILYRPDLYDNMPEEIVSMVKSLYQRNKVFRDRFDHRFKFRRPCTFTYLKVLIRTAIAYGYDEEKRLRGLAEYWCKRWASLGHRFDEAEWRPLCEAARESLERQRFLPLSEYLQKKRSEQSGDLAVRDPKDNAREYLSGDITATNPSNPAITDSDPDPLPEPVQPDRKKWLAFSSRGVAIASLGARRPKFDRYQDIPEQGIWDRTENYLRSLGYFALCSEFIESESLSLFQRFLSVHSPEYPFLKQRFRDLLADAARYVSISGDRTRKNIREAQSRASSGGRKTRSDKGSGRRAREIAELFAAGWTATEIARRFGVHRATVHKHLKVLKDSGGISKLYPDLQCLFAVPWARELFDLCRKHKHRLSRRGAHNVMVTVNKYARQVQQSDFLTVKRLRKALRPRGNDSIRAIEIAIKNAIAKQVVRQRPAVLALAEKLQRKGLRLIFPDSNGPRRIRFRYAMAVCLAFRIRERLRINGAPNQLIGNTEWIWQAVKDATTFGAAIEAPTNRFLNQKYPFDADGERAASVFHAREMGTAVSN